MKKFDSKNHTEAPMQLRVSRKLRAPINEIWDVVANHQGMTAWMPFITRVDLRLPNEHGKWEEGCERHCQFGPDLLEEKIVFWNPPFGYAYTIADMHLVKNHVGYIQLTEKLDGTLISWRQYFDPNGNILKKWMAKHVMLPFVMKKALRNIDKQTSKIKKKS